VSNILLNGITFTDIQKIIQDSLKDYKGSGMFLFDVSYLYNFRVGFEADYVRDLNLNLRFAQQDVDRLYHVRKQFPSEYERAVQLNKLALNVWHTCLEKWYNGEAVHDHFFNKDIKPISIQRRIDKIVNEGLEIVALCLTGHTGTVFKFHAIGEGEDLNEALASDTKLVDEMSRIDVTNSVTGGSTSRDGSTIYIVGNHPSTLPSATITETGVFDSMDKTKDNMLDHSIFDPGIDHDQFETSPGSTTVVYMCGI